MLQLSVGKKNPVEFNNGVGILWDESGFLLSVKLNDLSQREIDGFTSGKMKIDLVYREKIIFFVLKIQDIVNTSDIAFTAHISPNTADDLTPCSEGQGYAIHMVLTEGRTNIIKGMRVVALNGETSDKLYKCMKDQFESRFDPEEHVATVEKIQRAYTPKQLASLSLASTTYKG